MFSVVKEANGVPDGYYRKHDIFFYNSDVRNGLYNRLLPSCGNQITYLRL